MGRWGVKEREGGIVRRVALLDDEGEDIVLATRFLAHLADSGYSLNMLCAYAYDLRHLAAFLEERQLTFADFGPAMALEFLGYLRRVPSRRPAQRLDLSVATGLAPRSCAALRASTATTSALVDPIATAAASPQRHRRGRGGGAAAGPRPSR